MTAARHARNIVLLFLLGLGACSSASDIAEPLGKFSESVSATATAYKGARDMYVSKRSEALIGAAKATTSARPVAGASILVVQPKEDKCLSSVDVPCELGTKSFKAESGKPVFGEFIPLRPSDDGWTKLAELYSILDSLQAYAKDLKAIADAATAADANKHIAAINEDILALLDKTKSDQVAQAKSAVSAIGSVAQFAVESYIEKKKFEAIKQAVTFVNDPLQDFAKDAENFEALANIRGAVGEFYMISESQAKDTYLAELMKRNQGQENSADDALDRWLVVSKERSDYVKATNDLDDDPKSDPIVKIAEAHQALLEAIQNDSITFEKVFEKLSELDKLIAALEPLLKSAA